jgi:hypothetical protein
VNANPFCDAASGGPGRLRGTARSTHGSPPNFIRRCLDAAAWIIPAALLAILPKCPVWLAAYIALGTGLGIPLAAATYLRALLVILCVASLSFLTASRVVVLILKRKNAPKRQPQALQFPSH